ncbi:roadblock/LC7 domain-containing protein [Kitasatospora sp. NPDC057904]|uniref:roadblock/LC7 domain-containing protein n=1 Tax=unclassified Kitasatospora TaxID=2633591 RepID=UPI0036DD22DD
MTTATHYSGELGWLLDELVSRAPQARFAVILSSDGLAMATSTGVRREDGEHLAAVASAFHSLAKGAGRHFGAGEVRQTIAELEHGFVFVVASGQGTCLAVCTAGDTDLGLIAYEMARLVRRVGEHMYVAPRGAVGG